MKPALWRSSALLVKGMLMGAADVVPGVSGGTIAFVTGIYQELLEGITTFDLQWFKAVFTGRFREAWERIPFGFLLPLAVGIAVSIFSLARGVSFLLEYHPESIWSFFFGLICASVLVVAGTIRPKGLVFWFFLALGTLGAWMLVGRIPLVTPTAAWFTFLSGALAATAMILPGISGSFILVLLSSYHRILEAVKTLDAGVLVVFMAGAVAGLMVFSRVLKALLARYELMTMATLCGFMLGSLRRVWPYQEVLESTLIHDKVVVLKTRNILPLEAGSETLFHAFLMVVGFGVVLGISALATRVQKKEFSRHD